MKSQQNRVNKILERTTIEVLGSFVTIKNLYVQLSKYTCIYGLTSLADKMLPLGVGIKLSLGVIPLPLLGEGGTLSTGVGGALSPHESFRLDPPASSCFLRLDPESLLDLLEVPDPGLGNLLPLALLLADCKLLSLVMLP